MSILQQVWWNYFVIPTFISEKFHKTNYRHNFFKMIKWWYEHFIVTHGQHVSDPLSLNKCFSNLQILLDYIWCKVLFWCFSISIFRKKNDEDVLNDIDNMLQGLTEELDAMLEEELILDEWFCHALPKTVVGNEQELS